MKIAVISDIHANLIALKEVLKDIEKEQCDSIFCLGDLVLAGPQPKETLDFVKEQSWMIIQGNTDKMIADFNEELLAKTKEAFPVMGNSLEQDVLVSDRKYLAKLAPQLEFELDGVKILLVHGSPRYNNEDIAPNLPLEAVEEMIAGTDANLILCGHTHIPCGYQTNSRQTVVNVGSVGRPMTQKPLSCYAIVETNNGAFTVKHKFIDYDREIAAKLVLERNFEGSEQLAQMLLQPTSRHA